MKYTADYVRRNSVEIVVQSDEEFSKIKAIMGEPTWSHTNYPISLTYNYGGFYDNFCWNGASGNFSCSIKITAEEFIKDNEMIPEKWRIKVTEENYTFLDRYLHSNSHKYTEYKKETWTTKISGNDYKTWWFYSEEVDISKGHSMMDILPEFTEITFDQFLKITNQTNLTEFPKELIQLLEQIK